MITGLTAVEFNCMIKRCSKGAHLSCCSSFYGRL